MACPFEQAQPRLQRDRCLQPESIVGRILRKNERFEEGIRALIAFATAWLNPKAEAQELVTGTVSVARIDVRCASSVGCHRKVPPAHACVQRGERRRG